MSDSQIVAFLAHRLRCSEAAVRQRVPKASRKRLAGMIADAWMRAVAEGYPA